MSVNQSSFGPKPQFIDGDGNPAVGNQMFFYAAGSSTKQNTYTDATGNTANSNPLVLNALGQPASELWFEDGASYKVVYAPSTDTDPPASPIWTIDNISGINDNSNLDQWIGSGVTPTYISATQFTLVGDKTTAFHVNRRVRCSVTAGTLYGYISVSAFTTLTTVTVVLDSGVLDVGLDVVDLGLLTATNIAFPKNVVIAGPLSGTGITGAAASGANSDITSLTACTALTNAAGIDIKGTNINDSAAAGDVGEFISSTVLVGSAVGLTTLTEANVTSISLTAGDWVVDGAVSFSAAAGTSITRVTGGASISSASLPAAGDYFALPMAPVVPGSGVYTTLSIPTQRILLPATTTVYLATLATFSISTLAAFGHISARRVR
jgi:hypothetical protein